MRSTFLLGSLAIVFLSMLPAKSPALMTAGPDFEKQILPLLQKHCFACHDAKKQKAGLRLDIKSKAIAGGESGKVSIKPGDAAGSELYRRIISVDSEVVMPPTKEKLSKEQQELFKQWIDAGAHWPEHLANEKPKVVHWAYVPPQRPALPRVKNKAWVRNSIDAFVVARLEKEGLAPSPEADKATLIRRLYLDLLGLPPTPAQVDAFLADTSSDAYDNVVSQLLNSPHYGERWGRHWLDAARYADSDGYEKDKSRQMWFYRDWVVNAFNRDLPYNQFLRDQLAGDQVPQATQDQIVATGFLRNSMLNEEGGVDPEQFRMDAMFDRMDAIGKSMLGVTIQCAQCHNHKYDPISQEEYYKLFAFLNNDNEAQRVVYTPAELMKVNELQQQMKTIEMGLKERTPDWKAKLAAWAKQTCEKQVKWTTLTKLENAGDNGQRYIPQVDGSILAQGYAPTKFDTHLKGPSELKTIKAFRLEMLNDPNLPCNGPGRSQMGTFALSEFKVKLEYRLQPEAKDKKSIAIKFTKALADYSNPTRDLEATYDDKSNKKRITGSINFSIDGKNDTAWGIDQGPGRRNQTRVAIFVPEKTITLEEGALLDVYLTQQHGGWNSDDHMNNNLGRFRLSATDQDNADQLVIPPHIETTLKQPEEKRSPTQTATLFSYWRSTVPDWKAENDQIEQLWQQWPAGSTSLTVQTRDQQRETRLLKRGEFMKPDRLVQAGVPASLNSIAADATPNRLTLANWLTDKQAPTTARVFVNRIWQSYFGLGFVTSAEDFGVQCEKPTHPELLDWLAVEFMEKGWSIKQLHRLIVSSATYRQSSKVTPELLSKDPYNRLLARASRLRVEGEIVRDISLSVSGLLNPQVGGPSLFSPAPSFLFQPPASYGPFTWTETQGADRYRRALYTFRRRSTPYPMLTNFDAPNGDSACVRRTRSNTPLQALTTMNEVVFLEAARALGKRMILEAGSNDADRIRFGFRLCTSRVPTASELKLLETHLQQQRSRFADGWLNPVEVIFGTKELKDKVPEGLTPTQWASYTLLARALLNLDETITRE
jgi:hypothetical protein